MKANKSNLACILVVLLFCITTCEAQFVISKNTPFDFKSLHNHTRIINLKEQKLTLNEVIKIPDNQFSDLKNENTDLGFTNDNYWLHFKLKNATNDDVSYYIETSRPIVDVANFYQIKSDGSYAIQKSGDEIPFYKRSIQQRKTLFKISLTPNEIGNYYLHLKSDGEVINVPLIIRTSENLIAITSFEQIVFGFFYGMLLITFILYFFFYFTMKENVFFYYGMYVVFIGLLQFSLDGYFYQYVAPNSGFFSNKAVLIFAVISGLFLGKYAQNYLKIEQISKRLSLLYKLLYVCFGILFFVIIFIPKWFAYGYPAINALGLFLLLLIVISLIEIYLRTKKIYQLFTLGILSLITGFVIFILKNFSLLPYNFITENSTKLGTGLEVIFLSLSLANLIKKLKMDKVSFHALALQKSEEMNEMKSYFLSNISHELSTPLNTIMNFIESINGETDSKTIKEKCEVIKSSSNSLLSSVNDILDFSKIEKNEISLEDVVFDIHKLFDEIRSDILIRANSKELDFHFIQTTELPKMVKGDANRIRQIVMNLLSNSLKFTSHGIIKLKIESEIINDKVTLTFIISDTGDGIAKEKMNSIFDSFSQQTINHKRKYGGFGLGLYIVKALVDLHKGSIDMQSIVNQGTVCTVKLSVTKMVIIDEVKPSESNVYDLKGKRILVVEDNAMNQMVIKMITKKWLNTEVDYTANGEEALQIMQNTIYDVVLMDLQMPIMDGYEATVVIRSGNSGVNSKDIPIIAVTADVMESTKERVIEIGMDFYLSKPINKELLFETIQKCV